MERTEDPRPNLSAKTPFDESKLTPPQREALAIAKAQGVKFGRKLEDLAFKGVEPGVLEHFAETVKKIRDDARKQPVTNPFDE